MTYMDYVYDPKVQAVIEDYNNYVCPVPSSKGIIATELHDPPWRTAARLPERR
jgi:spermidine/putrescine transport system substrate-binding protein